jgi:hypothetical protein
MTWTRLERIQLKRLWRDHSALEIAEIMRRHKGNVVNQAHRMGLSARDKIGPTYRPHRTNGTNQPAKCPNEENKSATNRDPLGEALRRAHPERQK